MKFVLFPPGLIEYPPATQPWEAGMRVADVARVVRAADALGYDYLTMPDHIALDREHAKVMGTRWPEALTMLGYFAAITERIAMYTSVLVVPYRHPLLIAKGFATIDWLTGGRLALGVGIGHSDGEFGALGVSFADRGRISDEYLLAVKALWTQEAASFHGEHVDFTDIICDPRPVQQPHPPIFVGGNTKAAMRRAAALGDGWYPWTVEPRELPAAIAYMHDQPGLRDHPRPFEIVMPMARLNVDDITHRDKGKTMVPVSREAILDELGVLRDAGTTIVTTSFGPTSSLDHYLERITWFAEEILPAFREDASAIRS
jgi:probable F420-dependent oxidoreductase